MSKDKVLMWVAPEFKKTLKQKALDEDIDVLSLTRKLAKTKPKTNDVIKGIRRINKNFGKIL